MIDGAGSTLFRLIHELSKWRLQLNAVIVLALSMALALLSANIFP